MTWTAGLPLVLMGAGLAALAWRRRSWPRGWGTVLPPGEPGPFGRVSLLLDDGRPAHLPAWRMGREDPVAVGQRIPIMHDPRNPGRVLPGGVGWTAELLIAAALIAGGAAISLLGVLRAG